LLSLQIVEDKNSRWVPSMLGIFLANVLPIPVKNWLNLFDIIPGSETKQASTLISQIESFLDVLGRTDFISFQVLAISPWISVNLLQ